MTSSTKGLCFDLTDMPQEEKANYFSYRSKTNWLAVGFNQYLKDTVFNYFNTEPQFEEPTHVIFLNYNHFTQFLMLRHLDWDTIEQYFEPLNLRKPT